MTALEKEWDLKADILDALNPRARRIHVAKKKTHP